MITFEAKIQKNKDICNKYVYNYCLLTLLDIEFYEFATILFHIIIMEPYKGERYTIPFSTFRSAVCTT